MGGIGSGAASRRVIGALQGLDMRQLQRPGSSFVRCRGKIGSVAGAGLGALQRLGAPPERCRG